MSHLTFDDMKQILIECAGVDDHGALDGDVLDVAFTDLGYDSLAMLETAAVVARRFGVTLADADITAVRTPRQFLDLVNNASTPTA